MTHTYSTCDAIARHGGVLDLVLCGEAKSARQLLAGQKDPVCSARESPPALLAWTHPAGTASARATAGKHVPLPAHAFERSRIWTPALACFVVVMRCCCAFPLSAVRCTAASRLFYTRSTSSVCLNLTPSHPYPDTILLQPRWRSGGRADPRCGCHGQS